MTQLRHIAGHLGLKAALLGSLVAWGQSGCSALVGSAVNDFDDERAGSEGDGEGEGEGTGGEGDGGETGGEGEGEGEAAPALPADVQGILAQRCAACHFAGNVPPDLSDAIRSYNNLVAVPSELSCAGLLLVAPGDSAQSCLVRTVGEGEAAEIMPPLGAPLSSGQVDVIRDWIDGLPPDLRACEAGDERPCPCPEVSTAQACDAATGRWLACGCPGAAQRPDECAGSPQIGVSCFDPGLGRCPQHLQCDEDGWLACVAEYEAEDAESVDCNGRDDDCDGETDENFDLASDVEHCGACDAACDLEGATPACVQGRCVVDSCDGDRSDANRDPSDGCEAIGAAVLYVDRFGERPPDEAWPTYESISAALDSIQGDELVIIHLAPQNLPGRVEVTHDNVVIRGAGAELSTISAPDAAGGVTLVIAANNVRIQHLSVTGGEIGIQVREARDTVLEDLRVADLRGLFGQGLELGRGTSATGIHLRNSFDTTLATIEVSDAAAGLGDYQALGGDATGILAEGVQGGSWTDLHLHGMQAGVSTRYHQYTTDGRNNRRSGPIGIGLDIVGGQDIAVLGVHAADLDGFDVAAVRVRDQARVDRVERLLAVHLTASEAQGPTFNPACGVWVEQAPAVELRRATLADIQGGPGSAGACVFGQASLTVIDSIFANTGDFAAVDAEGRHVSTLRNSLIHLPLAEEVVSGVSMGPDTFEADPMFRAAEQRDYTLDEGSPAIDVGNVDCADGSEPSCGDADCISDLGYWAGTDQAKAACGG